METIVLGKYDYYLIKMIRFFLHSQNGQNFPVDL